MLGSYWEREVNALEKIATLVDLREEITELQSVLERIATNLENINERGQEISRAIDYQTRNS